MPAMTSEQIRDVAVKCVEGFLNDKVPLSEGLAKQASAYDMNMEQIKRACEATNTITHLKLMTLSPDRTVEFPVCKMAEVMSSICDPGILPSEDLTQHIDGGVEKTASESYVCGVEYSTHEKTLMMIKEAQANSRALEQLRGRSATIIPELMKVASSVRQDPAWLDKLSSINAENFAELSAMISGEPKQSRDFGGHSLFKEAQLKDVNTLTLLYKEAKQLVAETARRAKLEKSAEELTSALTKRAFVNTLAGTAGNLVGSGIAAVTRGAGRAIGNTLSGVGTAGKIVAKSKVGQAAAADVAQHLASGGAGYTSKGAPRDVWEALQS